MTISTLPLFSYLRCFTLSGIFTLFFSDAIMSQTIAEDSASAQAYANAQWASGSNGGIGWNAWTFNVGANTGMFIGNPANDGMDNTQIGSTAFGMYATGSAYANARRTFSKDMVPGDEFSFYWAMNFDANGGSKGFDFLSGTATVYNVNNGNFSPVISTSDAPSALKNYGTKPILVKMKRLNENEYEFSMSGRDGVESFSSRFSSTLPVNGIDFYMGNQNSTNGKHNVYFNKFRIVNLTSSVQEIVGMDFLKLSPNPVSRGADLNLRLGIGGAGRYDILFYSLSGICMGQTAFQYTGAPGLQRVQLPAFLAAGLYIVELRGSGLRERIRLVVE